jgi:hypothetical protein
VQNGTPLFALQELGGWELAEMVRRYEHLAADVPRFRPLRALSSSTPHIAPGDLGTVPKQQGPAVGKPLTMWLRGQAT